MEIRGEFFLLVAIAIQLCEIVTKLEFKNEFVSSNRLRFCIWVLTFGVVKYLDTRIEIIYSTQPFNFLKFQQTTFPSINLDLELLHLSASLSLRNGFLLKIFSKNEKLNVLCWLRWSFDFPINIIFTLSNAKHG